MANQAANSTNTMQMNVYTYWATFFALEPWEPVGWLVVAFFGCDLVALWVALLVVDFFGCVLLVCFPFSGDLAGDADL